MTVGDYWEQTEEITDIAYLNGIKVSPEYYEMYHNVVNAVEEFTDADDPIFVFPHAPIFYLLTDRHSDTYTKVQWFDVASDEEIVADIDVLREDPPKAIVFFHIPRTPSKAMKRLSAAARQADCGRCRNFSANSCRRVTRKFPPTT